MSARKSVSDGTGTGLGLPPTGPWGVIANNPLLRGGGGGGTHAHSMSSPELLKPVSFQSSILHYHHLSTSLPYGSWERSHTCLYFSSPPHLTSSLVLFLCRSDLIWTPLALWCFVKHFQSIYQALLRHPYWEGLWSKLSILHSHWLKRQEMSCSLLPNVR